MLNSKIPLDTPPWTTCLSTLRHLSIWHIVHHPAARHIYAPPASKKHFVENCQSTLDLVEWQLQQQGEQRFVSFCENNVDILLVWRRYPPELWRQQNDYYPSDYDQYTHCRGDQYRVHVAINKTANTDHPRGIIRLTRHCRIDLSCFQQKYQIWWEIIFHEYENLRTLELHNAPWNQSSPRWQFVQLST